MLAVAEQCAHKASFTLQMNQAPSWPCARSLARTARDAKKTWQKNATGHNDKNTEIKKTGEKDIFLSYTTTVEARYSNRLWSYRATFLPKACVVRVCEGGMPSTCPLGHPGATDGWGGGRSCSGQSASIVYPLTNCRSGRKVELHSFFLTAEWTGKTKQIPATVLVTSFTVELVGRKNCEDALLRAEVLPLYSRVGLQVVCQHCRKEETQRRVHCLLLHLGNPGHVGDLLHTSLNIPAGKYLCPVYSK